MASRIRTGSEELDKLLKGGYESGIITVIYGPAGSGKTNFCMLSAARLAEKQKVIYLDTEGGFSVERLGQLAKNSLTAMRNINFLKVKDLESLKRAVAKLKLSIPKEVGLVIVDSIAMPYRAALGKGNVQVANNSLAMVMQDLLAIAREKQLPVLLTNQVYADVEMKGKLHPIGGDIVRYASKCMIELKKDDSNRVLVLQKHRSIEEKKSFKFRITNEGISMVE